jgi:hypothetical protein
LAAGTTQATQGELQFLRLLKGVSREQVVNALLGSDEGQAVEEFESLLGEGAVTDDLADQFLGASVVGFWAAFGAEEDRATFLQKKGAELEVTLTAIAEFGGRTVNTFRAAFALDEHGEFAGNFIVGRNG